MSYLLCTLTAQLEKAKFLLSSRPQTGIRSPSISGPRPSFLARFRCRSRPVRTLSGSRADAERVDPELGGSCGDASVLFAAGEDLCGVVAPRRCFGPTRCRKNIYLWCLKYLWCLMVVDSSWVENVVRARVTAGCWSCVEIRTSTSTTADSYLIKSVPDFLRYLTASCWSWVENVVRATVTAGCWTCVGMGIFLIVG